MSAFNVTTPLGAQGTAAPAEFGRVAWRRNLDAALADAKAAKKPVAILFQEVPGCATCRGFGDGPLSHPFVVAALESACIPVAVFNNKSGPDAEVLSRFKEPAWNNPVVRFVDGGGKDVIPRADGVWDLPGFAARIAAAITAAGSEVPAWFAEFVAATTATEVHQAVFTMYCFWEGEMKFGGMAGVTTTQAVLVGGEEGVLVTFDPKRLMFRDLVNAAAKFECARRVYAFDDADLKVATAIVGDRAVRAKSGAIKPAPDSDQKHQLSQSPIRFVPLTPTQLTRINSAAGQNGPIAAWLTPHQAELVSTVTRALAADPKALDGLTPPAEISAWPEYETRLGAHLSRPSKSR